MLKKISLAAPVLLFAGMVEAQDVSRAFCTDGSHFVRGAEIAVEKGCLGCHTVLNKRIGPPYQEIARKYASVPAAAETLARKIKAGGSGNWGDTAMPANPVTDEEASRLAQWILSLGGL